MSENFVNKPDEQRFSSYSSRNWEEEFRTFAATLVRKADELRLDSVSLGKVLKMLREECSQKFACRPVGAYQTKLDGELVWIVTMKWEYASWVRDGRMSHIAVFAFLQKNLKKVDAVSCN